MIKLKELQELQDTISEIFRQKMTKVLHKKIILDIIRVY